MRKKILFEYKGLASYPFNEAIGFTPAYRDRPARLENPKGPKLGYIVQAGLNAKGLGADTVVIGYFCKAPIPAKQAAQVGLRNIDRFLAEWWFERDEWEPLVQAELLRLRGIHKSLKEGLLPERQDFDDDGTEFTPDPEVTKRGLKGYGWRCQGYCPFTDQCLDDGPGRVPVRLLERQAS